MAEDRVTCILRKYDEMAVEKANFMNLYQAVAEFIVGRRMDFTTERSQGEFLTGKIFDTTATMASRTAAASYVGQLFPSAEKTIRIDPPYALRKKGLSKEVKDYYDEVTRRVCNVFKNPKAGFILAHQEFWADLVTFGTSGISVEAVEGVKGVPVRFKCVDAKVACIDEGPDNRVDTVYMMKQMTVRQLVLEYGYDKVSKKVQEAFDKGKQTERVKVLHAIEPRIEGSPHTFGVKGKPIGSIHIEKEAKHILREKGFDSMPIFVSRFWKYANETYGRSPSTELLPDIITIDGFREIGIEGAEMIVAPPLLAKTDAISGGVVDATANAIIEIDDSYQADKSGQKVVEPLHTVGDMGPLYQECERITKTIYQGYSVDRLLDLNSDQRMTAEEVRIRDDLRSYSLGDIFDRSITETYHPMVERTVTIMGDQGLLGVERTAEMEIAQASAIALDQPVADVLYIPDAVLKLGDDQPKFEVTFISPAAMALQAAAVRGITEVVNMATELLPVAPELGDVINFDEAAKEYRLLRGAPAGIIRADDEIEERRDKREAQQQAAMQLEAAKLQAETAKSGGAAYKSVADAEQQ